MTLTAPVPFDADTIASHREHVGKMAQLDLLDKLIEKHTEAIKQERHYRLTHANDVTAVAQSWIATNHHRARIDQLCTRYDVITGHTAPA